VLFSFFLHFCHFAYLIIMDRGDILISFLPPLGVPDLSPLFAERIFCQRGPPVLVSSRYLSRFSHGHLRGEFCPLFFAGGWVDEIVLSFLSSRGLPFSPFVLRTQEKLTFSLLSLMAAFLWVLLGGMLFLEEGIFPLSFGFCDISEPGAR